MRQAKQIEAQLLEEVGAGRHKGSRSRTMAELLERWLEWRPTVRPIRPPADPGRQGRAAAQGQHRP
jgi:hypothetical protein